MTTRRKKIQPPCKCSIDNHRFIVDGPRPEQTEPTSLASIFMKNDEDADNFDTPAYDLKLKEWIVNIGDLVALPDEGKVICIHCESESTATQVIDCTGNRVPDWQIDNVRIAAGLSTDWHLKFINPYGQQTLGYYKNNLR